MQEMATPSIGVFCYSVSNQNNYCVNVIFVFGLSKSCFRLTATTFSATTNGEKKVNCYKVSLGSVRVKFGFVCFLGRKGLGRVSKLLFSKVV